MANVTALGHGEGWTSLPRQPGDARFHKAPFVGLSFSLKKYWGNNGFFFFQKKKKKPREIDIFEGLTHIT